MPTLPRGFFSYFFQQVYSQRVVLGTWAIFNVYILIMASILSKNTGKKKLLLKISILKFFKKCFLGRIPWMGTLPRGFFTYFFFNKYIAKELF
jgi:hypothetical protein